MENEKTKKLIQYIQQDIAKTKAEVVEKLTELQELIDNTYLPQEPLEDLEE